MTDTTATDATAISWRDEDVRGFGMAVRLGTAMCAPVGVGGLRRLFARQALACTLQIDDFAHLASAIPFVS